MDYNGRVLQNAHSCSRVIVHLFGACTDTVHKVVYYTVSLSILAGPVGIYATVGHEFIYCVCVCVGGGGGGGRY